MQAHLSDYFPGSISSPYPQGCSHIIAQTKSYLLLLCFSEGSTSFGLVKQKTYFSRYRNKGKKKKPEGEADYTIYRVFHKPYSYFWCQHEITNWTPSLYKFGITSYLYLTCYIHLAGTEPIEYMFWCRSRLLGENIPSWV